MSKHEESADATGKITISDEWGTGFLFMFAGSKGDDVIALVTNKHVRDKTLDGVVTINGLKDDGKPNFADHRMLQLASLRDRWILHPDDSVDLAILPMTGISIAGIEKRLNIGWFSEKDIPSEATLGSLNVVENVLMPGYPGQLWDSVNNVPIFRRGTTASLPSLDFQGKSEFLVDAAIWPGSSGSPVIIMDDIWTNQAGDSVLGRRFILLGVVQATATWTQDGFVATTNAPLATVDQVTGYSHTPIPDGIGIAIKSSRLLDFKPILVDKKLLT